MKKHLLFPVAFAFAAALLLTGCPPTKPTGGNGGDSTAVDTTHQQPGHDYGNAVIKLSRSTCFGTCPAYDLEIKGSGAVSYNGYSHVAVSGPQTATITPDAVKALVDEFFAIDYFALQDSFDSNITDIPSCVTSIAVDGKSKRIYNRHGGPEKLNALQTKIDETANVAQWITAPER